MALDINNFTNYGNNGYFRWLFIDRAVEAEGTAGRAMTCYVRAIKSSDSMGYPEMRAGMMLGLKPSGSLYLRQSFYDGLEMSIATPLIEILDDGRNRELEFVEIKMINELFYQTVVYDITAQNLYIQQEQKKKAAANAEDPAFRRAVVAFGQEEVRKKAAASRCVIL